MTMRIESDEWAAENPPPVAMDGFALIAALRDLYEASDLWWGPIPAEVLDLLEVLLARRDGAAQAIATRLREWLA